LLQHCKRRARLDANCEALIFIFPQGIFHVFHRAHRCCLAERLWNTN
jgi:hypothetical protein